MQLFLNEIRGILSYRCLFILGDDGNIEINETSYLDNAGTYVGKRNFFRI